MRNYEGMFLLDSARATKEPEETAGVVLGTLERYGAKVLLSGKWDERKLSYSIKRSKRGVYYLVYFQAGGDTIAKARQDLLLKEEVLRFLILAMEDDETVPEKIEIKKSITEDEPRFGRGGGRRDDRGPRRDRESRESRPPKEAAAAPASKADAGGKS